MLIAREKLRVQGAVDVFNFYFLFLSMIWFTGKTESPSEEGKKIILITYYV